MFREYFNIYLLNVLLCFAFFTTYEENKDAVGRLTGQAQITHFDTRQPCRNICQSSSMLPQHRQGLKFYPCLGISSLEFESASLYRVQTHHASHANAKPSSSIVEIMPYVDIHLIILVH